MRSSNGKILNYSGMTAYEGKSGPGVVIVSITNFYHCWCHRFLSLLVPVTGIVICFEYSFSLSFLVIEQMVMWHLATQPKCYLTQPSLQLTVALWHRSSQWEGVVMISRKSHNRERVCPTSPWTTLWKPYVENGKPRRWRNHGFLFSAEPPTSSGLPFQTFM